PRTARAGAGGTAVGSCGGRGQRTRLPRRPYRHLQPAGAACLPEGRLRRLRLAARLPARPHPQLSRQEPPMTPANRGLVLGAAGIALMCGMDAVAKALGAELTAFQVVFVRYLGSAAWLALWIALTGGTWPHRANIGPQALRAVMLVATEIGRAHV